MPYTLPADVDERPVVIDGAGVLGRRIAAVYSGGGSDVRIFDLCVVGWSPVVKTITAGQQKAANMA
jgi:3-hydroxybutyryl-CoA dehydrogenase